MTINDSGGYINGSGGILTRSRSRSRLRASIPTPRDGDVYSDDNPDNSNVVVESGPGDGTFEANLAGLSDGTVYRHDRGVSDTAGNTATGTGAESIKDTTADSPAELSVTINDSDGVIDNSEQDEISFDG